MKNLSFDDRNNRIGPSNSRTALPLMPVCYGQLISTSPSLVTLHAPIAMYSSPTLINVWKCSLCGLEASIKSAPVGDESGKKMSDN